MLCYVILLFCLLCSLFVSVEFPECEACYYDSLTYEDHQQGKS